MYQMPPEDLYEYAQVEMGRRIRRARKALGWTQEDLGDATGIDQTRISVFERGRKSMHLRTLPKTRERAQCRSGRPDPRPQTA